ncbi:CAP-Gly domain-containing linker protein 1-like isoform X3 [Mercenaria mercenaria]|uniref:CAP-Gly domain-containing linker protein 1-like isoform X3 n=1 Tax=Mercenaria mercenaria TaxID=6596 RepID=UPI00234E7431|nr:CAP-Gly domain-containing linker protein 1-like isoform X3 [Mercenaria mercenaria]
MDEGIVQLPGKNFYSSGDISGPSDRKPPEKKRSFLQQPKSFISRLPAPSTTYSQPVQSARVEAETPKTQPIPIPQTSPGQNTAPDPVEPQEFFIGDRVTISGVKTGTLLYFGNFHLAPGLWCGIAIDEPDGTHDGLVGDVRYFTCRKGHGIFAPVERVAHLDHRAIQAIVKSPPKVSQLPSKSKLCHVSPIRDEISYHNRSNEFIDECDDVDEDILGLDEHGIIHDEDDEIILREKDRPKRILPKLPRPASHAYSRLQYVRRDLVSSKSIEENITDEALESLHTVSSDGEDTDGTGSNIDEKIELQHSAGGSSGGEDSWSLNKDYIAMCDGKAQYLNITFDGESESKTSTQEPSEESPSPEFIFDQEMIEDGEFASQPMEMSRDSSLGLISSFALDKNDLLNEIFGNEDEEELATSQGTLEPMSEDKDITPEKQDDLNMSVEFDESDLAVSTPYTENKPQLRSTRVNLNATYTQDDIVPSQVPENKCLNSTYTQDDLKPNNKVLNSTFTQEDPNIKSVQNLNGTFTLDDKTEEIKELEKSAIVNKGEILDKVAMTDSGISMRGSMTDSAISVNSNRNSLVESSVSLKGSLMEPGIRRSMLDSGIVVQSAMYDSNLSNKNEISQKGMESDYEKVDGSDERENRSSVESDVTVKNESVGLEKEIIHKDMDDRKLIRDLSDGHNRKERPVSFLSTTSADTGYAPDTDSEIGTLTLNSPQEWLDKGFHGNIPEHRESVQKNLIEDFQGDLSKMGPVPVESDSDFGTMTGDTDNEADRTELLRSEGVTMDNIQETEESEDEVTQVEDIKALNSTVILENKQNDTYTAEVGDEEKSSGLDSTFTLPESNADDKSDDKNDSEESVPIVTITIEDKDGEKKNEQDKNDKKKVEKQKTPKKKKFNVVKDFKKPNTTNVVSKLSEYLKTPVPVKPREDKSNTEEFKNKRNSLKGKIDLSKVTSKIANRSVIEETKKVNGEIEKKEAEPLVEKEPVKKIKRTPPKSKWDAIMSQIDTKKDSEKAKPKTEVKSKLEAFLHIPPPTPPKKEEPPKPKKKISTALPDYSKVQSKLKYTAPPPKPKVDESPNRTSTASPNRKKKDTLNKSASESQKNKLDTSKSSSPGRISKDSSPSRDKENIDKNRRSSTSLIKNDRVRNLSGDSVKRPLIKDKAVHIDLADSLDGRGSVTGTGSVLSSRQSSRTDMSTTEDDAPTLKQLPQIERAMSLQDRRDSSSAFSEISESGSQVTAQEMEMKLQKAVANQQRRKSGLLPPSTSLDSSSSGEGGVHRGGPKIVKPVLRQQSMPSPLTVSSSTKRSLFPNKASTEKAVSRRSRNQNRNKTSKSKKESKEKNKPPETVLAEVHTKEVQRLEALCESRTKQLNMVKLQLQTSNLAFDGMSCIVNYLAHDLDGFSAPRLVKETENLKEEINNEKTQITGLQEQKSNLEGIIAQLKEQHKDYVNSLEAENEKSLKYQRETLISEHQDMIGVLKEQKAAEIGEIRKTHEAYITRLEHEHAVAVKKLQVQHGESIKDLQRKQENQMEEHHKQHQDKLEEITGRFDSIKLTLSEKVETLRSECDRLRDRAHSCEEALQRDSDFKVQCALAPYKNLPQEIESLKTVLEMRNEEINKLRNHNTELKKKLEELPVAQEKIIALQQKKENLEAIISMKTDHEKVLHERCQNLMRKYDKESRANKRLSMEYEELMWKLSESFSETDLGSQEALFYQKLGMSPTGGGDSVGPLSSPGLGRKLRTPPGSESSPSKSPGYRRTLSSSVDDREEKKLKRRSGNYLLDEKKHRPTSPLAKQNPLTKSWSPSTQSESPVRTKKGRSGNKMSQSWCVDMDPSDNSLDSDSKIPRSHSSTDKVTRRRATSEGPENSDSDKAFVSLDDSNSSQGLNESELSESLRSIGISEGENLPSSSTPKSESKNIKLQTSYVFNDENTNNPVSEKLPSNVSDSVKVQVPSNVKNELSTSGQSVSLSTGTVSCPVSKLPTRVEEKPGKDGKSAKSHTETTV